ncbi:hypothetical protein TREMEDRAFT_63647 [Tremella mesenterica DSM 1558]|uniref:uncharacterized protein n=1 Tax=Tremella mesenterica (strain ATCC 24925 / CBS 8224 / DSM 1558 / NBRC 9311 / NRRL Y-6157 / RJB 2259-6 / UBC 559-6) TaxID=578456 RepID=UPI0003F49237|nr:uncharacterized protein TREMEDRAFT_63647 [Tremella mesenterica DSM 1558]EIW68477.1 hypothetical protein TREMEDRAFT_63647 [Tremella mesenterica DSM 1558]
MAGPSRLPATPSAGPSRPTRSRPTPVSAQEGSPLSLPPALGTRSRQPSVPPASGLSTPAPPVKTPPKSSKGKGKKKKAVQFEPAVVENESTQLPEEIPPALDHPTIAFDPRIPEEDKQLATFRSTRYSEARRILHEAGLRDEYSLSDNGNPCELLRHRAIRSN